MLEFESVSFGYAKKKAPLFENLSLHIEAGQIYGLLGLNGMGKTSLLKLAAGGLFPQSGSIRVHGRNPGKRDAAVLADIIYVPEDPWAPSIDIDKWLELYAPFRPAFNRKRFAELVQLFGVERTKSLAKVSYGQRKKFAVAAALASGARIILLDEPTNGLDIPSKGQLRRALAEQVNEDCAIIVSTHQVRDLEAVMDPILILHEGKIVCSIDQAHLAYFNSLRVKDIDGLNPVYAEQDAMGWSVLLLTLGMPAQDRGNATNAPDLEQVFAAAINAPANLQSALEKITALQGDRV